MMPVYSSKFTRVKTVGLALHRIVTKYIVRRILSYLRARSAWLFISPICVLLVLGLLAFASPSARQILSGSAKESQTRIVSLATANGLPNRVYRGLVNGHGPYQNWTAYAAPSLGRTAVGVSSPGAIAHAGPASDERNMMPLLWDPPPAFTDNPLTPGVVVQAVHITELRDAINLVRAHAGLGAASWAEVVTPGVQIKAAHILEMRTRLDEARLILGLGAASYSDPSPTVGGSLRAAHVQELRDRVLETFNTPSGSVSSVARLDPLNQTGGDGENPLSRNYNWNVPLVSLPGRGGLDLNVSLSYNSLVWTKVGTSSISFNEDHGFPGPGFRLGFPVIQPSYFNPAVGKNAFLLITSDGGHTELRKVGTTALYESADSSHLMLDASAATLILRTTDGTRLSYVWQGSDYQCTEIKDRNGNFITITYTSIGRVDTVVDTLGRTVKFNYDTTTNDLSSITQTWTINGQAQTHAWASFSYIDWPLQTNFNATAIGPTTIRALKKVTFADNSSYAFDYTCWGQIWKITNHAADSTASIPHVLSFRAYNLPGDTNTQRDDCPRFTERHDWAENWNRSGSPGQNGLPAGPEQEVLTASWIVPESAQWTLPDGTPQEGKRAQVTSADGTINKIYYAGIAGPTTGWNRGLPSLVETWAKTTPGDQNVIKQRSSVTLWHQDVENVSYPVNPRIEETNVYDFTGAGEIQNRARTTFAYQTITVGDGTSCQLPKDVLEYQANASTVLRRTHFDYEKSTSPYLSRRIIGLVTKKTLFGIDPVTQSETLMSSLEFEYDENSLEVQDALQHDNTNYGSSFAVGRANLTSIKRNATSTASAPFTMSTISYNTLGSMVKTTDPENHETRFSYLDQFSANGTVLDSARPATFAYPTVVTDPDGYTSRVRYHYDFGAVTWKQTPLPNTTENLPGPEQTISYDNVGRILRTSNLVNGAYARYVYSASQNRIDVYTTVLVGASEQNGNEDHSVQIFDGHGRTIANAGRHSSTFSGQLVLYDQLGRVIKKSNPTETNSTGVPAQWLAVGDDAQSGWFYQQQSYDWKGRPLITTNADGTITQANYSGCGCAGGEVTTLTDEVGRRQKRYTDVLGRTVKSETLNPDGSTYSTIVSTYNARDQITLARHYQGAEGSSVFQDTTISFDGFGRLQSKHVPEQNAGTATVYSYNLDDTIYSITDGRGAVSTFNYNGRRQIIGISYSAPSGIPVPGPVGINYDAVGNRLSMSDGAGSVTYAYDQLSRITSESRYFSDLNRSYALGYGYNLAGQVTTLTDDFGAQISYGYDQSGGLTTVTGAGTTLTSTYASGIQYRAWGTLKHLTYGNGMTLDLSYSARMQVSSLLVSGGSFWSPNQNAWQPALMSSQFGYYSDGRIKSETNLLDSSFDRAYSYDHLGALSVGYTNQEARDFLNGVPSNGTDVGPYRQSYQHDAFANMTHRETRFWSTNDTFNATYDQSTNRNTDPVWQYDADGNLLHDDKLIYKYDVAGRVERIIDPQLWAPTQIQVYDADGLVARNTTWAGAGPYITRDDHNVYSTVLGGRLIIKVDPVGRLIERSIYANGDLLAREKGPAYRAGYPCCPFNDGLFYLHRNPVTGSSRGTGVSTPNGIVPGYQFDAELDTLGVNVGLSDPFQNGEPPSADAGPPIIDSQMPSACVVNGIQFDCASAGFIIGSTSAVQCPYNDCSPIAVTYQGRRTLAFFHAYGDGYQGFVPVTARYVGNGGIAPIGSGGAPTLGRFGSRPDTRGDTNLGQLNGARHPEEDLGQGAGGTSPQKPGFDIPAITTIVTNALAEFDCAEFARTVLDNVASKKNPVYPNGGTLADVAAAFFNQPKKHDLLTNNMPSGSRGYGNPIGNISKSTGQITTNRRSTLAVAEGVVSELFHMAGEKAYYDDKQLATAVNNSIYGLLAYRLVEPRDPKSPIVINPAHNPFDSRYKEDRQGYTEQNQWAYSDYFHTIQSYLCHMQPGLRSIN